MLVTPAFIVVVVALGTIPRLGTLLREPVTTVKRRANLALARDYQSTGGNRRSC